MRTLQRFIYLSGLLLLLASCAYLNQDRDPPKVSLESFRALPTAAGSAPRFEIRLRIINPNQQPLDIAGISYDVALLGRDLLSGVTSEVPLIQGYSEEVVRLEAGLQLFELLGLLGSLGRAASGPIDYTFDAKIDLRGPLPAQRIRESGTITLQ